LLIAAGKVYSKHAHAVSDEVFVMEGSYADPGIEGIKEYGPGSYLYYPAGTEHNATSAHLLDTGTDLHTIKELLGHSNISTTMIYLHLQTHKCSRIINPLDQLHIQQANGSK